MSESSPDDMCFPLPMAFVFETAILSPGNKTCLVISATRCVVLPFHSIEFGVF